MYAYWFNPPLVLSGILLIILAYAVGKRAHTFSCQMTAETASFTIQEIIHCFLSFIEAYIRHFTVATTRK